MNLSEALSELKIIKTRIARTIEIREKTISYSKKSKKPERSYKQLTKEIGELSAQATALKSKIIKANVNTKAEKGFTLQDLILTQGGIRSEISSLKKLTGEEKRFSRYGGDGVFDNREDYKYQTTRFAVEECIRELETEKRKLDAKIQSVNWRTKL